MEDGDVILIAPPANNQDGSQTFYILDPCPSSEDTDEPPEIEIIDMTAEVKNTGAIAVVSTNSSTGALEITLTNKGEELKVEAMDSEENVNAEELNDSPSNADKEVSKENHSEEDLSIKLEEGVLEDDDISSLDCTEIGVTEQTSEGDSLNYEVAEQSQHIDTEQEDEVEEGTLYIDDNKDCETCEEQTEGNIEDTKSVEVEKIDRLKQAESAMVCEEIVVENSILDDENVSSIELECVGTKVSSSEGINSSAEEEQLEKSPELVQNPVKNEEELTNNQEPQTRQPCHVIERSENQYYGGCEAIVHGQVMKIPASPKIKTVKSCTNESVDSTNTALTLLELAGGSTYRSLVEQDPVEMEILQLEEPDGNPSSSPLLCTESQPAPELTTLTTLQPVPLEATVENSLCNEDIVSNAMPEIQSESSNTMPENQSKSSDTMPENQSESSDSMPVVQSESSNTVQETQPESSSVSMQARRVQVSSELVQRLLENEESSKRPQYKHLTRHSVTKSEIAQEIYERARQKYPYTEDRGRDVIFAMKIAHRLASKIVSPEKCNELADKSSTEAQSLSAENTFSTPLLRKDFILKCNEESKIQCKNRDAISDKIELLKILEDDPDDITESDLNQSTDKKPKLKVSRPRAPLLKLHPELEKELALKQLQNFGRTKKKVDFVPEVLNKLNVQGRGRPRKNHEHNNNSQNNVGKRKFNNFETRSFKKLKSDETEEVDSNAATVDPSQITETLTVEGQNLEEQPKDGKSLKQYSNKRLSRNSETPPREVPMEILLNGIEDDENDLDKIPNVSKNKIFKATNTRKRQEELKKKHFANVLQRNKPQKKRGRPPKKKPVPTDDMLNKEFLMKVINEQSKPSETKNGKSSKNTDLNDDGKSVKTKKMREIERLLGDEGAINMLYSVEQKRQTGSEPKRGVLPSYRRKKKDLILKTKLVKSAVLRLSASPLQTTGRISLRGQGVKDDEGEQHNDEVSLRKMSVDSRDSHQSISSPPGETFSFPAKIVPAEASRIIRRHSSSSNYSSRSNSPRRLSVDGERSQICPIEASMMEMEQGDAPLPNVSRNSKTATPTLQSSGEGSKNTENHDPLVNEQSNKNLSEEVAHEPKTPVENKKSGTKTPTSARLKSRLEEQSMTRKPGRPRKILCLEEDKKSKELNTTLAAAIDEFTKESENVDKNIPEKMPRTVRVPEKTPKTTKSGSAESTSKVAVYSKSTKGTPGSTRKKQGRHVVHRELTLKRQKHLVEIILEPVSSTIKNALNIDAMRELIAVLSGLIKDENCRVVLFRSTGDVFCQGVDFPALVQPTSEQRLTAAQDMALAIKELVKTMAIFPKPIVAAVQGPAVGLGTTLLPLCDLVLASSEATFHTPYARLGQVPEGGATLLLPSVLGYAPASELLFLGQKLTAPEAQRLGLVTRILPVETFQEDVMSVVNTMATQSGQAMSATKALLRHSLLPNLETTLVSETHLLTQHWTSPECQTIFTKYLEEKGQGNPAFVFTQP